MPKKTKPKIKNDFFDSEDEKRVRSAIRKVWQYSYQRKQVKERCLLKDGHSVCENCFETVIKIHVDHIEPVGIIDEGFIRRLFVPSDKLQGLCDTCHREKTNAENRARRAMQKELKYV